MTGLSRFRHLVMRFFGVVFSRRLSPGEQARVNESLRDDEAQLFWHQQPIDQRHSFAVASAISAAGRGERRILAAALLHDVGKRHSRLGPIGRSLATVADSLRLPMPARWQSYRDHGLLGARDLAAIGADPLVIAFASGADHPDAVALELLRAADDGNVKGAVSELTGNSMPPEVK